MGFLDNIKRLFKRKKLESNLQLLEQESEQNFGEDNLVENTITDKLYEEEKTNYEGLKRDEEISLSRDFIYGYIIKTLKSIEESLKRIEANMITKDWASLNLSEKKDLENVLKKLEEKLDNVKLLTTASSASSRLSKSTELIDKAHKIIMERKEISYEELARELGISASYLRAIASLIEISNPKIKRIIKDKKGFFVYDESARNV
ncbi:MAG: hypothetical protein QW197_01980 [Candidatus Aenigmatarchaeota archaeon]